MAKRKAGVSDIIYELDNEDLVSSGDEVKEPKIICKNKSENIESLPSIEQKQDISELSVDDDCTSFSDENYCNGGKTKSVTVNVVNNETDKCASNKNGSLEHKTKSSNTTCETVVFNDNIHVNSLPSNSDLGNVVCENRTPLISVRFKDNKQANHYKKQIKEFLLNLIKYGENESVTVEDTDLELEIWADDSCKQPVESNIDNNLYFVDTDLNCIKSDIPVYDQASTVLLNLPETEDRPTPILRRGPSCFNCDGGHAVRDCPLPRNNARIAEKRKTGGVKLGRYHVEDDQKHGHLIPGRISGQLRDALGLKRNELPLHIYRMRVLGYPPGWLEDARISHSGITMFDSSGNAILDPEEEEGEMCEPGSKDKFDIKKILDFPGFNVEASSRYREESNLYGLPPFSEYDSKITMLQTLAPNAMKAYKRKKLIIFPSAQNSQREGQAEMDLDSGDEAAAFPSVPPLPDDEPPPPPPPPPPLPASPPPSPQIDKRLRKVQVEHDADSSDLEIIEVIRVPDIPIPFEDLITIDDADDDKSFESSDRNSPTIDDLENKKRLLLDAINADVTSDSITDIQDSKDADLSEDKCQDDKNIDEKLSQTDKDESPTVKDMDSEDVKTSSTTNDDGSTPDVITDANKSIEIITNEGEVEETNKNKDVINVSSPLPKGKDLSLTDIKTPEQKTGFVKTTFYGTPILNATSPYVKLPSDDKFAKDITDIIQFENLPNSVGKYKKISGLLKKVKCEVDRIQES